MAGAKKVTKVNHLPGKGDGNFRVYSKQFNELVDNINLDGTVELSTSITASTVSTQASGTALTAEYNIVTVCATAGDSVLLPAAATGKRVVVVNLGAAACDIFPASGDAIDEGTADVALSLGVDGRVEFISYDTTNWKSDITSLDLIGPLNVLDTVATQDTFTVTNNALTTASIATIASSAAAITSTGRLLDVSHTGALSASGIIAEFATAAADETVLMKLTASAALALGKVLHISAVAVTTGTIIDIPDLDALTTGGAINVLSNSSSTGTRILCKLDNTNTAAVGTTCLTLNNDATAGAAMAITGTGVMGIDFSALGVADSIFKATGTTDSVTSNPESDSQDEFLKIDIGGTAHYIPCYLLT